ncbi:DUF3604 domain-containing protein [Thalassotalea sp. PLHSN55]|uniref:DUF3604 domain-containing protein n=1 Tax=Thalassotalea sp. PLHSN55 TaxID=3435888 RepID=UPI003F84C759
MKIKKINYLIMLALLGQGSVALANEGGIEYASNDVRYSPNADREHATDVYFGDTHLHTSYSTDAGLIGNTLGPEEAYKFARGEQVVSSHGISTRLTRALDFLVVADHAENMGLSVLIEESNPSLLASKWGKEIHDISKVGTAESIGIAYDMWAKRLNDLDDPLKEQSELLTTMWHRSTTAAEKYNTPGLFTAFIGFEWTLQERGNNLHRNVIFRDGKTKADQITPISQYDAQDPERLWDWMEAYEKDTGGRMLAIPHNGNLSNGLMFDDITLRTKKAFDKEYAERRMKWEPLYEVTQMKGDGEAHPFLSPEDEFADFETMDKGSFGPEPKQPDMLRREYAREAYKRGLEYTEKLGANPFKFGMVGSTDSHTSIASAEEDNYFGKVSLLEPTAHPIRFKEVITARTGVEEIKQYASEISGSGLAAVWARENTREALWDAMANKETYATTGPRMRVRVFGGYDFTEEDLTRSDFADHGYDNGVPMGGDLAHSNKAPKLLIKALKDSYSANLDRVQVVKGWFDKNGKKHERIYDVAVSDDRKIGSDGRCKTPVGNTVNVKDSSYNNSIGAASLQAYWQDPDFDAAEHAFYYVRVLEIPTPRWTTRDAKVFGKELPPEVATTIQERAYTTPIWYTPK